MGFDTLCGIISQVFLQIYSFLRLNLVKFAILPKMKLQNEKYNLEKSKNATWN